MASAPPRRRTRAPAWLTACPGVADCVPASVTVLVLLGVATVVVSGLIVFGVNSGNGMLVTVGTVV